MRIKLRNLLLVSALFYFGISSTLADTAVTIETSAGTIELTLFDEKAPKTVENFIAYAREGFYNDTVFHRVIPKFMIQGGGFEPGLVKKATKAPIVNEANPAIPNKRGSIAMARTNAPDSATAQFFINVANNNFLNKTTAQAGYAVFGEVTSGMEVVDAITITKTGRRGPYSDVPVQDIVIKSISINSSGE